jgi:hypothetical protein
MVATSSATNLLCARAIRIVQKARRSSESCGYAFLGSREEIEQLAQIPPPKEEFERVNGTTTASHGLSST